MPGGQHHNKQFNAIDLKDAYAVHIHGSRGSHDRLALMKDLESGHLPEVQETLFL